MTATVPDVETIGHLDFEATCQWAGCRFGRPAAEFQLVIRNSPCPCGDRNIPICRPCTEWLLDAWRTHTGPAMCAACGTYCPLHASAYARIEPLP